MTYKTSGIGLNIPPKVLSVSVTNVTGTTRWPHNDGAGDRWWQSGSSPKFYKWTVTMSVTATTHGSHLTRDDFQYNGLDVTVGDWIADVTGGKCLKIIGISSKTSSSVTCEVEDWLRYNTFNSSGGTGVFGNGDAVVFNINEDGLPMLDPFPDTIASYSFYPNVMGRFQYLNPQHNYVLDKTAHGFAKSDVIAVASDGSYVKANSLNLSKTFGIVTEAGPGPNQFIVQPFNKVIDFNPALPGTAGSYIYADTDGDLTTSDTGKVVFLKIKDAVSSTATGSVGNPTLSGSANVAVNNIDITFSTGANITTIQSGLNAQTSATSVTASTVVDATTVTASTAAGGLSYGVIGSYVDGGSAPQANISSGSGNTTITFTTTTAGQAASYTGIALAEDFVTDIKAANIPNLTATAIGTGSGAGFSLTEANGNAINIYTITNDKNGNPFVGGSANTSGLVALTSASTAQKLKLTRSDGGEILLYDNSGAFTGDVGIFSSHTGSYPIAVNIEQGIRQATVTVYNNITARDAAGTAATGDQAYVLDNGVGEWALYLYDGSGWVKISDEDSANTDAQTLTTTFTAPIGGFGNSSTTDLGNISPGGKIQSVSVEVHTVFSGQTGGTTPIIEVGTTADPDLIAGANEFDLEEAGTFLANPEYLYPSTATDELELKAKCSHFSATAGNITVKVTYI